MSKALSPVVKIAKYTFMDVARQKSFIVMFALSALFLFLVRGCYQGHYMVNGQTLDADTVIGVVSKMTFHVIAAGVLLLTALLSMRVFRRDRDEGMQSCILSKPIARWQYVAGKLLGLWTLSTAVMFVLHGVVFITASLQLQALLPEYLLASLLCSFNLFFVVVAVLLFSLLMPDIAAFLCVMGIGIVGLAADGISAISQSPVGQAMMGQPGSPSDMTAWKWIYYAWPKLAAVQRFAASFIGSEGVYSFGSVYPLINVLVFGLVCGALLFRLFQNEEIV